MPFWQMKPGQQRCPSPHVCGQHFLLPSMSRQDNPEQQSFLSHDSPLSAHWFGSLQFRPSHTPFALHTPTLAQSAGASVVVHAAPTFAPLSAGREEGKRDVSVGSGRAHAGRLSLASSEPSPSTPTRTRAHVPGALLGLLARVGEGEVVADGTVWKIVDYARALAVALARLISVDARVCKVRAALGGIREVVAARASLVAVNCAREGTVSVRRRAKSATPAAGKRPPDDERRSNDRTR